MLMNKNYVFFVSNLFARLCVSLQEQVLACFFSISGDFSGIWCQQRWSDITERIPESNGESEDLFRV